jgi:superfamily II DNA or RNA helicase
MRPLTAQFAADFDSTIQHRGAEYFRGGRVRIGSCSTSRIVATVLGTSPYLVTLRREGGEILATCSCPYFETDFCKHIWAVMLTADNQRLFQGENLQLVPDDFEDVGFDDSSNDDDGEGQGEFEGTPWLPALTLSAPAVRPRAQSQPPRPPIKPKSLSWREQIAQLHPKPQANPATFEAWPSTRELLYVIDVGNARIDGGVSLEILCRDLKLDGGWGKPKSRYLRREWLQQIPSADDRHILAFLAGAVPAPGPAYQHYTPHLADAGTLPYRYRLVDPQLRLIMPVLCRTGRCHMSASTQGEDAELSQPLQWQEGEAWDLRLQVRCAQEGEHYELTGALARGQERMDLTTPLVLFAAGMLFTRDYVAPYEHHGAFNWIALLRVRGPLRIPVEQGEELLTELLRQPRLPPLDLPQELRYEQVTLAPRPRLAVKTQNKGPSRDQLRGELSFDYNGTIMAYGQPDRGAIQPSERRLLLRDFAAEAVAEERLRALGCHWAASPYTDRDSPRLVLTARGLPDVVRELITEGWYVEAEGKLYRSSGKFEMQVSSGVDWFELHGVMEFGDTVAKLPELLAALRRGENTVRLGDGSYGVLPRQWLQQYGLLAELGNAQGDHLRFRRSQVGVLDVLLSSQPEARCDALFSQLRDELRGFCGLEPIAVPAGFKGVLRPYQKDALAWFEFLRRFGFGGCLADDMGLGKTVQVLALLEARREIRERCEHPRVGPSLAVVPKSLLFNWKQEAARFAPRLRVLDHTGSTRVKGWGHFEDYDLVLTTYGTLRMDATDFKNVRFDYVILDEAQAIKSAESLSAKCVRLLQGDYRLALSGTPIENHLGELWSLFEFLNPGMLGAASVFKMAGAARNPDEDTRKLLARALRPFILRRTKQQVAPELPAKIEQTIHCELDTRQRRLYDQMRDHYRATLLKRVATDGIERAKIQILEALLRLRQAAIHPALLDKGRVAESSAKLDVLLPRVLETVEEGHKTLVFSQFTGMLAIVRQHLDREGVSYEYLDGKTRDRQACVERFQTDPDCKLFLISLKAGGVGLNLTAAQYVFLLDPWWNPAVEAQAIDRAHRIGQTNQVFAYRLIARGTVEEKVVELQNTKRDLADAIVGANEGLIRNLGREDLELLLS